MAGLNICYFGADDSWENLLNKGFYRRNTCILRALSNSDEVGNIYVLSKATRLSFLKKMVSRYKRNHTKVKDVYFIYLLPNVSIFNAINSFVIKLLLKVQCNWNSELILWCYLFQGYELMQESKLKGLVIFDADHNIINEPNLLKKESDQNIIELRQIISKVDIVLSSTRSMNNWFHKNGSKLIYRLRNGVDKSRFTDRQKSTNKIPVIGYCGTLSNWINFEIFEQLVRISPEWHFHIIGKPYKNNNYKKLQKYTNVRFFGFLNSIEVSDEIQIFDVALCMYKKHEGLDVDSMKIYEYLASNTPVVSTKFHDFLNEDFNGLIKLGETEVELKKQIQLSINSIQDYSDFIKNCTWDSRVNDFINFLKNVK